MNNLNVLIIEDEPKVAAFIKKGLEENNYSAQIAPNGRVGHSLAIEKNFQLAIIDINLPYINGFELCRLVKEHKPDLPVLMLTAFGTIENKLTGYDAGTDDYLVKPFEFRELLARMKALLKRTEQYYSQKNTIKIADLELNSDSKEVFRKGKAIELTAREFMLLEYLMKNKGRVISRSEIAEKIWEINFDTGTNVIDVYINFLRKKIDKDFHVKLIHTQIGMGYMVKE